MLFPPSIKFTSKLNGYVIGIKMIEEERCYVAIEDSDNAYYSGGYHHVNDRAMCSIARAAFLEGKVVAALTELADRGETNGISSIQVIAPKSSPYWPPYGRKLP